MYAIDFHTHCFPDAIYERAIEKLAANAKAKPASNGSLGGLIASMDRAGVGKSVLLQIATKPSQTASVNRWAIEKTSDRIIGFGSVHPQDPNALHELDVLAQNGAKGIKLHPEYQQFYVDDDSMIPVYEHAIELGLIIVFHAGIDIGMPPPVHCSPDRILRIYGTLSKGNVVLAHCGGWKLWDEVEAKLAGSALHFDTAFCSRFLPLAQFRRIVAKHGAEKILLASDSPWEDPRDSIAYVKSLELPPDQEDAILYANAARLLGMGI